MAKKKRWKAGIQPLYLREKKKKINPPYRLNFPGGTDSLESTKNSQQN